MLSFLLASASARTFADDSQPSEEVLVVSLGEATPAKREKLIAWSGVDIGLTTVFPSLKLRTGIKVLDRLKIDTLLGATNIHQVGIAPFVGAAVSYQVSILEIEGSYFVTFTRGTKDELNQFADFGAKILVNSNVYIGAGATFIFDPDNANWRNSVVPHGKFGFRF